MKILGISGSLRHDSYNTALLRNVPLELELWDGLKEIPPYDEDDDVEPAPPAVAQMRAAVAGADAMLFATPEYNASVPGQLKNAVDWLSRPRVDARCGTSRSRSSARAPARSAPSGRRPSSARCSPRPARASSTRRSRSATRTSASTPTACSLDENLKEQLQEVADALVAEVSAHACRRGVAGVC